MSNATDEFPLHECVFKGDVAKLSVLIRKVKKEAGESNG